MGWVKLDDAFFRHPKIVDLTLHGKILAIAGLCHTAEQLTDGILTDGAIRTAAGMAGVKATARKELTARGVWHEPGHKCGHETCIQPPAGSVIIHDYLSYNPSAEKELKRREEARARTEKWRQGRTAGDAGGDALGDASRMPPPTHSPSPSPDTGANYLSSSSSAVSREPVDDDDQDSTPRWAKQAATIVASSDLTNRVRDKGPVRDPKAWLGEAERRALNEVLDASVFFGWDDPDPAELASAALSRRGARANA